MIAPAPSSASAAKVEVAAGELSVAAAPGERNVIRLGAAPLDSGFRFSVRDRGTPPTAGPGCSVRSRLVIVCEASSFAVRLADGDDVFAYSRRGGPSPLGSVDGGSGADDLRAEGATINLGGGPGDDFLSSRSAGVFAAAGTLRGGSGADRIAGRVEGAPAARGLPVLPGAGGVLVVGDSLELSTGPYLRRRLAGIPLTIRAVSGYSSDQVFKLFKRGYRSTQSVVVFDAGTNDSADYPQILARNLDAVAERIGARCMVVPTIHYYTYRGTLVGNRRKNRVVRAFAASRPGTRVPDWAHIAKTRPDLLQDDRVHPNPAGADVRAGLIAEGVQACLRGGQRLLGGPGDDVLKGGDVLYGGDGNDRADGLAGADRLRGEDGDDRLTGSSGRDRFSGGPGADAINSRRGDTGRGSEPIACGSGVDRVTTNSRDRITRTCNLAADPGERIGAIPRQTPTGMSFRLRCKAAAGCRGSVRLRRVGRRREYARARYRLSAGESGKINLRLAPAERISLSQSGGVPTRIATAELAYTARLER